ASMIHSAWTLLACRSAASAGSARYSRVTSNPNSRVGNASTARPSHSRGPAAVLDTREDPDTAIESMSSLARGETTVLGELYRVTILPIILLSEATAMAQRSLARSRPELSAFLLQHRRRLAPADVGLPPGGRRRTPGLRREEVAALAGVGLTWYTWFEQGRGIGVSESFLLGVARALRLDDAECCHLFLLAQGRPPPLEAHQSPALDPLVQRLMDDLPARPAYILDLRWDVLAWNRPADGLFGFSEQAPDERNLLRMVFASPRLRRRLPAWEEDAAGMLAEFKRDHALAPDDPALRSLVDDLQRLSPRFRRWWKELPSAARPRRGLTSILDEEGHASDFRHATLVVDEYRP